MAVKIRLRRVGVTKRPTYRVVVTDSTSPRDGRFIEIIGHYNPLTEPAQIVIKADRVDYWTKNGAKPTPVVAKLLAKANITTPATEVPATGAAVES